MSNTMDEKFEKFVNELMPELNEYQIEILRSGLEATKRNIVKVSEEAEQRALFDVIEKALGFKLFGWQKTMIIAERRFTTDTPVDRGVGKTTAYILWMIFSRGVPIHLYGREELEYYEDEKLGKNYSAWFFAAVFKIYSLLSETEARSKMRKIYFSRLLYENERQADRKPTLPSVDWGKDFQF